MASPIETSRIKLDELPNEILVQIFTHLLQNHDIRSLEKGADSMYNVDQYFPSFPPPRPLLRVFPNHFNDIGTNILYVNRRLYEVAYPILYDNVVTYHISHGIKTTLVDGNHELFLQRLAKAKRGPDGNGLLKKLLISIEPFYFYDDMRGLPTNEYIARMILRACKGFHEYQTCFDKVILRVQSANPQGCPGLQVLHLKYLFGLGYLHCKSVSHNWIGECAIKSQLQWCLSHPVFVRPLALINLALWRFICKYTGHPALGDNGGDWGLRAWFISRMQSASMDVDAKTYCLVADMTVDYVIMMAETGRCGAKQKRGAKGGVIQKVAKKLKKEISQVRALITGSTF